MKYIKLFEKKSRIPQLNDYVLASEDATYKSEFAQNLINFIDNNIGKIIRHQPNAQYPYLVEFEGVIPEDIKNFFTTDNCRGFRFNEILDWDTNKEELEVKISAKKYNL